MPDSPPDQGAAEHLTLCLDVRWAAQGAAPNAFAFDRYQPPYVLAQGPLILSFSREGRRNDVATAATFSLSPCERGRGEGELPVNTFGDWYERFGVFTSIINLRSQALCLFGRC